MYAIINVSGKQYKVSEGTKTRLPKQIGEIGSILTFEDVLFIDDGENKYIGNPILPGASVTASIINHRRDKKILIYKKKRRKGYQRKNGHRQWFTEVEFKTIKTTKNKSNNTETEKKSKTIKDISLEEE